MGYFYATLPMLESILGILWFLTMTLFVVLSAAGAYYAHKYRDAEIPFLKKHEDDIRRWFLFFILLSMAGYAFAWMFRTFPIREQFYIWGAILLGPALILLLHVGAWWEQGRKYALKSPFLREENWIWLFYTIFSYFLLYAVAILTTVYVAEGDMMFVYEVMGGIIVIILFARAYDYWDTYSTTGKRCAEWMKKQQVSTKVLGVCFVLSVVFVFVLGYLISPILFALMCFGAVALSIHGTWLAVKADFLNEQKSDAVGDVSLQMFTYLMEEYDAALDCQFMDDDVDMIRIVFSVTKPFDSTRLGSWVCNDIRDQFGFGRVELTRVSGGEGGDTEECIVFELLAYYKGEGGESTT